MIISKNPFTYIRLFQRSIFLILDNDKEPNEILNSLIVEALKDLCSYVLLFLTRIKVNAIE
jgi:hypothetical protein